MRAFLLGAMLQLTGFAQRGRSKAARMALHGFNV